jgi:hypothetical protein
MKTDKDLINELENILTNGTGDRLIDLFTTYDDRVLMLMRAGATALASKHVPKPSCWKCGTVYAEKPKLDGGGRWVYVCGVCGARDDDDDAEHKEEGE